MFERKAFLMIVVLILFSVCLVYSQNQEWINYTNGINVAAVAVEGNYIWAGTSGGLVNIDKISGSTTFYNKANSGLPTNYVHSIAIDASGNKWIACYRDFMGSGWVKFDGTNWTVYNTPGGFVSSIVINSNDDKWIGSFSYRIKQLTVDGLSHFDGRNWRSYFSEKNC